MFGSNTIKCQSCNAEIDKNANFCPHCRTPTSARMGDCPFCGQKTNLSANYCTQCRMRLPEQPEPAVRDRVWRAGPEDFAVRLDPENIDGRYYKDIEIQIGQQAVILVDGRAEQEPRGPGIYTAQTLFERFLSLGRGQRVRALIVQGGPVPISFELIDLRTADGLKVKCNCEVAVAIANPTIFFAHTMRQQQHYTQDDLRRLLFEQVRNAVREYVSSQRFDQLASTMAVRQNIDTAVQRHLEQTLADSGLSIREVRTAEFEHPRLDAINDMQSDTDLTIEELRVQRDRRERLGEQARADEDLTTEELTEETRIFEERAAVWERMRRAMSGERANEIRSEQDFADFLAEIDNRKVLREEELDILKEEFANRKQDRHAARAQIAYLARLEHDYERKRAELAQRSDFTLEQMASMLRIEQQKLIDAGLMDEQRWQNEQAELLREAERDEWKRTEKTKWEEFERDRVTKSDVHRRELEKAQIMHELELEAIKVDGELSEAQKRAQTDVELARYDRERREITLAIEAAEHDERMRQIRVQETLRIEIEALEDEQDIKLAKEGVDLLAQMQQNRLNAQEADRRISREDELERQRAAHEQSIEQQRLEMEAEEQQRAHELTMRQALADLPHEALIAEAGPQQAALLASLKETEALQGMSAEQILAMKDSPAVADAFKEKFKAMNEGQMSEQEKALYDRLFEKQEAYARAQQEFAEAAANRQTETTSEALKSVSDVAKAYAENQPQPQSPNIIVVPSAGSGPQVIQSGGGVTEAGSSVRRVQVCPNCGQESEIGVKFCSNCQHQFHS